MSAKYVGGSSNGNDGQMVDKIKAEEFKIQETITMLLVELKKKTNSEFGEEVI